MVADTMLERGQWIERQDVAVVQHEPLIAALQKLKGKVRVTQNYLATSLGVSTGQVYRIITDLKALRYVDNGNGLTINKRGLNALNRIDEGGQTAAVLRDFYLEAPAFSFILKEYPEANEYVEVFQILQRNGDIKRKNVQSATRRYLEYIKNQALPEKVQSRQSRISEIPENPKGLSPEEVGKFITEHSDLVQKVSKLVAEHGAEGILNTLRIVYRIEEKSQSQAGPVAK